MMGNLQFALADYDKSIELDPELGLAHYNRSLIYLQMNRTTAAIEDLRMVLEVTDDEDLRQQAMSLLQELGAAP
jgi:tetratricopeptide (TPR) repeat protein